MTRKLTLPLAFLAAACGSSDDTATKDVASPGGPAPSQATRCDFEFGESFALGEVAIMEPGQGRDFTGDGVPDNHLAWVGPLQVNAGWVSSFDLGHTIMLVDFGWPDPDAPRQGAPQRFSFFMGSDADSPPDPDNNYSGDGEFFVPTEQFDLSCSPTSAFPNITSTGDDTFLGEAPNWLLYDPNFGSIRFASSYASVHFTEEDGSPRMHADVSAVWTACGLFTSLMPGGIPGTILPFVVQGAPTPTEQQPDVDRDGDGLETFTAEGQNIVSCTDGDGTVIEDPACACDPRIQDGYSVAIRATGVPATILGTEDTASQ